MVHFVQQFEKKKTAYFFYFHDHRPWQPLICLQENLIFQRRCKNEHTGMHSSKKLSWWAFEEMDSATCIQCDCRLRLTGLRTHLPSVFSQLAINWRLKEINYTFQRSLSFSRMWVAHRNYMLICTEGFSKSSIERNPGVFLFPAGGEAFPFYVEQKTDDIL